MAQIAATQDRVKPGPLELRAAAVVACFGVLVAALAGSLGAGDPILSAALPPALISAAVVTMIVTAAVLRYFYQASSFPPHAILGIAIASARGGTAGIVDVGRLARRLHLDDRRLCVVGEFLLAGQVVDRT